MPVERFIVLILRKIASNISFSNATSFNVVFLLTLTTLHEIVLLLLLLGTFRCVFSTFKKYINFI